jgi:SAM-dependent methyltransferase
LPELRESWRITWGLIECLYAPSEHVTVLDIGCSDGAFLCGLRERCRRLAIEPNGEARARLRQLGVTVVGDWLEPASRAWHETIDVVTLFDVFEHLDDPAEGLRSALSYVKPGGNLIFCTGDLDAWNWRLLKGQHWYLDSIQHVSFANRAFVRGFCNSTGTELVYARRVWHTKGNAAHRLEECLATLYFTCKSRGGVWRFPQLIMHSLPGLRRLRHMQLPPYTQALRDHCLFHLSKECHSA